MYKYKKDQKGIPLLPATQRIPSLKDDDDISASSPSRSDWYVFAA